MGGTSFQFMRCGLIVEQLTSTQQNIKNLYITQNGKEFILVHLANVARNQLALHELSVNINRSFVTEKKVLEGQGFRGLTHF